MTEKNKTPENFYDGARQAAAAAKAFADSTPEWYPTEANKNALWKRMTEKKLELTTENFKHTFEAMMQDRELEKNPDLLSGYTRPNPEWKN